MSKFVRLSKETDHGKPYESIRASQDRVRNELSAASWLLSSGEKMNRHDERQAFEEWFKSVEIGDGTTPLPTPLDMKRWDEYVERHSIALAAWLTRAALEMKK